MSTILLSTIVRDRAPVLDRYHAQLCALVASQPQHTFLLSVYENDSTDGSAVKLASLDWSFVAARHITSAHMGTHPFVGGKHPLRVAQLADARNRTLFHSGFLPAADWVLVVEPDIVYTPEVVDKLINHEQYYQRRFDIFTAKSSPISHRGLYDSWASRVRPEDSDWCCGDDEWAGLQKMWTTFSCFALYRADAIRAGHTFAGTNPRTGQSDCDTAVICERFHAAGYHEIYWDTANLVYHP